MDLLNTKQYTAKRNSAHTGSNVEKCGVIIKLPKSTVSSYETKTFLPALIRKKKSIGSKYLATPLTKTMNALRKEKRKVFWTTHRLGREIFVEWFQLVRGMRMLLKAIILLHKGHYWPIFKGNVPN